jgi:hypothetical protein
MEIADRVVILRSHGTTARDVDVAIIYPNALKKRLMFSRGERDIELVKLDNLMRALFFATLIVAVVIVLGPVAITLKLYPWFIHQSIILRGLLFSILIYLTLVQLWTLVLSIAPADFLSREVRKSFGHQDNVDAFKSVRHVG